MSNKFNYKIPVEKEEERNISLLSKTQMMLLLKELSKMHGIELTIGQAYLIISNNEKVNSLMEFCRFFESFVKTHKK
jgi:hypothetical protein